MTVMTSVMTVIIILSSKLHPKELQLQSSICLVPNTYIYHLVNSSTDTKRENTGTGWFVRLRLHFVWVLVS